MICSRRVQLTWQVIGAGSYKAGAQGWMHIRLVDEEARMEEVPVRDPWD